MDFSPKISVITPSYNMGEFIKETIVSVKNQTYLNFEHIIIDGDSNDNTVQTLEKYPHLKWISEPDEGQSDAYNKALKMATGDLVLCLNADDYLLDSEVFQKVVNILSTIDRGKYSAFMGNIIVSDVGRNKIGEMNNRNRDYSFNDLLNRLPVVIHPGTFFNRKILLSVGGFAADVHYVMDYDIFLKCAKVKPIHSIDIYISSLRKHTGSKGMGKNNWKFSSEFIKLRIKNGGKYFNKLNLQPLKVIIYHLLGRKVINFSKKNKLIYYIANKIGITKLNRLTWYDEQD